MVEPDALIRNVEAILWDEWDPIGVGALGGPDDEYDSYAPRIAGAILQGVSADEIAAILLSIETDLMGLDGNAANVGRVATLLVSLR
jgi:hypothetical protein